MSKRIINFNNYSHRAGSHSMTGSPHGYSDIKPKHAIIEKHSGIELEKQKEILSDELSKLKQLQKKRRLLKSEKNRINSLYGMIGNINKTLSLCSYSKYEEMKAWIFMRIANMRLEHAVFKEIDIEAEKILMSTLHKENR